MGQCDIENSLINDNIGLVIHIAKSFRPRNPLELDDYIQLGRIGLLKAIRKYDPSKGSALSTYSWYYISGEIMRHINKEKRYSERNQGLSGDESFTTKENVEEVIPENLTHKERFVVERRLQNHTFTKIAEEFGGYTPQWASKIYKNAVQKIKNANGKKENTSV